MELILTGYTSKKFVQKKGKVAPCCYLCKRKKDDAGVYISKNKNEFFSNQLSFELVSIIKNNGDDIKFDFWVCSECVLLLEAMIDRNILSKLIAIP